MNRYATWQIVATIALALAAVLLVLPNFLPAATVAAVEAKLPSFIPFRPVTLGLDLQGGAHVLMEIDSASLQKSMVEGLRDDVRGKMRDAHISISGGIAAQAKGVVVHIADAGERAKALEALQPLNTSIGSSISGAIGHTLDISDNGSGAIQLTFTDAAIVDKQRQAIAQSIEVLNRRINDTGTKETNVQQEGADRIVIEVPGLQDTTELKKLLGATAKLEFRLAANANDAPGEAEELPQKQGGTISVEKRAMVQGEDLVSASAGFDQQTNEPIVNFRFNFRGAQAFGAATAANVDRPFAIVLDGVVISAPVIRSPIPGGTGQISGRFTVDEANELAVLLSSGALPAKLTIVEENTVGPGLGQDQIDSGKRAALVGGILVVAYMLATYGIFGIFADVALLIHILFIFASMALLGATLTLPGIAGVVFTIGMAVDSNVLIYERIREESHQDRTLLSALDTGFRRAFATIVDSNVTMFVAAVILYVFGSGAVRGSAVSLGLGILTSIITAVTMTRMMIGLWYARFRPSKLPI